MHTCEWCQRPQPTLFQAADDLLCPDCYRQYCGWRYDKLVSLYGMIGVDPGGRRG